MKQIGALLSAVTWLLVAGSIVVLTGGLFGRPLLLAAVPTGSMLPVLVPGDMIVVLPTWMQPPTDQGDIVVFKTPEDKDWIVHRIIGGSRAEGFVTKGDANQTADAPRVFPRDIAGVVPHWENGALRLPRLGILSLAQGPFSSPVVAGIALVMGIYLLVMDVRPRKRSARPAVRFTNHARPQAMFTLYLGLSATVFITTLIPAWTLSSSEWIRYSVTSERSSLVIRHDQYIQGQAHFEEIPIKNPSPLPLVVVFAVGDPNVTYEPDWALVPAGGERRFMATVRTPELGTFTAKMNTGIFLPLLPPVLVAGLAKVNMAVAAVVVALIPTVLVLSLALLDQRSRMVMTRFRARLAARFGF